MTGGAPWIRRFELLTAALLIVWLVLPLVPILIWSFARGWRFPDLLPREWTLQAWSIALSDRGGVLESLGVSLMVAGAAAALAVLIGVPAGRALGTYRFRGRGLVEILILAPIVVPGIAVALGLHGIFVVLGFTNTVAGVVLAHLVPTVPYVTLVMAGVFAGTDPAYERQARSLGATPWQALVHVTLPAAMPGIVVGGLFAFLVSWSQYVPTLAIGGGRVVTMPLLLFAFAAAGRNDVAAAVAVLYVLPGVLVLVFTARYLTGVGVAAGGLGRT